jgi:ferritin-like protein
MNPIMQFFEYSHLPQHLREVSEPFATLAAQIDATLPNNAEKSTALRKLLEAKDCAVRAKLFKREEGGSF